MSITIDLIKSNSWADEHPPPAQQRSHEVLVHLAEGGLLHPCDAHRDGSQQQIHGGASPRPDEMREGGSRRHGHEELHGLLRLRHDRRGHQPRSQLQLRGPSRSWQELQVRDELAGVVFRRESWTVSAEVSYILTMILFYY